MPRTRRPLSLPLTAVLLTSGLLVRPAESAAQPAGGGVQTHATGGSLYDELADADRRFFDALFHDCDAALAQRMVTDDVEFYDDRTGFTNGDVVRQGFERMTGNCPAGNGVERVLLPESVEVFPLEGVGALQTGTHHFVEEGAATSTVARFFNIWTNVDGSWRVKRIVSADHRSVDADAARRWREVSRGAGAGDGR